MKRLLILILAAGLISCGAAVGVDFDETANFDQLTTYNYYPNIESGLSQLDDKRVMRALDSLLPVKGITKSENPDVLINFFTRESIRASNSSIGIGVGTGGRGGGVGISGGIPVGGQRFEQEFTLDFVETMQDKLLWQGVTTALLPKKAAPEQKQQHYTTLITRILKKYPPSKK